MNLHLHGHLAECILDYGPVYSFWLFPFERLNGILGKFHTNCHGISLQLMRRFLDTQDCGVQSWPLEYKDDFAPLIEKCNHSKGLFIQTSLEQLVDGGINYSIEPIPPVLESSLEAHQRLLIAASIRGTNVIPNQSEDTIEVMSFYHKC